MSESAHFGALLEQFSEGEVDSEVEEEGRDWTYTHCLRPFRVSPAGA
jgi:hypothetical protein